MNANEFEKLKERTMFDSNPDLKNTVERVRKISSKDFDKIKSKFESRLDYLLNEGVRVWNFFEVFMPMDILYYHIYSIMLIKDLKDKLEDMGITMKNYIYVPEDLARGRGYTPQKIEDNIENFKKVMNFFELKEHEDFEIMKYFDIQPSIENIEFFKYRREIQIEDIGRFLSKINKSGIYGNEKIFYGSIMDIISLFNEAYTAYRYMSDKPIHFMIASVDRIFLYNYFIEVMEEEYKNPPAIYPIAPLPPIMTENDGYLNLHSKNVEYTVNSLRTGYQRILDYLFIKLYMEVSPIKDHEWEALTKGAKMDGILKEIRIGTGMSYSSYMNIIYMNYNEVKKFLRFLTRKGGLEIMEILRNAGDFISLREIIEKYHRNYGGTISSSELSRVVQFLEEKNLVISKNITIDKRDKRKKIKVIKINTDEITVVCEEKTKDRFKIILSFK